MAESFPDFLEAANFVFFCASVDKDFYIVDNSPPPVRDDNDVPIKKEKPHDKDGVFSETLPTIIIHGFRPLKISYLFPNECIDEVFKTTFQECGRFLIRRGPSNNFHFNILAALEEVEGMLNEYYDCKNLESMPRPPPIEYDNRKVENYFDDIVWDAIDIDKGMPFKCEKCGQDFKLTNSPENWLNFRNTIRGEPFFTCKKCKSAVSKIEIIDCILKSLKFWQKTLVDQKVFYKSDKTFKRELDADTSTENCKKMTREYSRKEAIKLLRNASALEPVVSIKQETNF